MKKFLVIGVGLVVVVVLGMTAAAWMGVRANDNALSSIKEAPGVIVLDVAGMT